MTNDLPAGTSVGAMTFESSGYTLSGNSLTLLGDVVGTWRCSAHVKLGAPLTLRISNVSDAFSGGIDVNGQTLSFDAGIFVTSIAGPLDGTGSVAITGIVSFSGGSFSGPITGTLQLTGALPNAEINGGQLTGGGSVGVTRIDAGQAIVPKTPFGDATTLETKSLTMNGTYYGWLFGTGASSQVKVTGSVSLGGTLNITVSSAPLPGQTFTIIDNDGNDAVTGTFSGLLEGATFSSGGAGFQISYHGGDGNDVVLTASVTKKHWTGAISGSWANSGNWSPQAIPAAGEELTFPEGAANQAMTNDLPAGTTVGAMTFGGASYTLSGNSLTLLGDVVGTWRCSAHVKLGAPVMLRISNVSDAFGGGIDVNGQTLSFDAGIFVTSIAGPLDGTGSVAITAGVVSFSGGNFSGPIAGTLQLTGALPNAEINGGQLTGGGSVGVTRIDAGQAIVPKTPFGDAATLETKSLTMNGTYYGWLFGTGASSQVKVTGSVSLGGTLNITVSSAPLPGQTFTIIDNDGNDAVTGTFSGLPEGAILTLGSHRFRLTYHGGDGNDVVLTTLAATAAALSQNAGTTKLGEPVTFTATVTSAAGSPSGSVTFTVDGQSIGTAPAQNGVASLTASTLPAGSRTILATFAGTGVFGDSPSNALTHTVSRGATASSVASAHLSSLYGQPTALTATVVPQPPATGQPSGSVTFVADGVAVGTAPLIGGTATFSTSTLSTGSKTITAQYAGDAQFDASTSSPIQQTIAKAPTAIDARPRMPLMIGASPLITVFVNATTNPALVPNGSVSVSEGGTLLAQQTLVGGAASVTLAPMSGGEHKLVVTYSGAADFETSTIAALQTVTLPAISVGGAHVVEGTSNMTAVTLEVILSAPSSAPAHVSFSTLAASAAAGVDYQAASGVIEFAPGEQTKSITLQVFGDALLEEDEMFSVVLSDPVNAAIENGSAIVVIANDDQAPARRRPSKH